MESRIRWIDYRRQVRGFGTRMIAVEYVIIIATLYVAQHVSVAWWPLLAIVIGHSQWTLTDNIGHWASHSTLFRKESLNRSLEWLYFYPVFGTLREWEAVHELHHRYVGQAGKDPQCVTFDRWGLGRRNYWWCFLVSPYSDFRKSLEALWVFRKRTLAMYWLGILALVFLFHAWGLFALWIASYFTTRVYAMFFSESSEHWNAEKGRVKASWGTRNLTGMFYLLYKRHADNLHDLHHRYPGVPPEQLPRFYKAMREESAGDFSANTQSVSAAVKEMESAG